VDRSIYWVNSEVLKGLNIYSMGNYQRYWKYNKIYVYLIFVTILKLHFHDDDWQSRISVDVTVGFVIRPNAFSILTERW